MPVNIKELNPRWNSLHVNSLPSWKQSSLNQSPDWRPDVHRATFHLEMDGDANKLNVDQFNYMSGL